MMDKKTREEVSVPYGICVWSTGVAPQSITKTIMNRIPYQNKGLAANVVHGCVVTLTSQVAVSPPKM